MSDKERAKELFIKGTSYYHDNNYQEALKYFLASEKIRQNDTTSFYIESCKKRMSGAGRNTNSSTAQNTNGKSKGTSPEDVECEKILNIKDYYDLLKVTKDSTLQDIKKSYKKLAIKFHPDKNQSSKAEEAFKKIATAYQTLSDPEKRKMYDKYGTEEEYREKYYQAHQRQYEEEFDPYDILHTFFSGNFQRQYANQHARRYANNQYNENQQNQNPQNVRLLGLIQILPIIMIFGLYILSDLFKSVPLYQFTESYDYRIKKRTSINKIDYFVGNTYTKTYPTIKSIKESGIELNIERDYLLYVKDKCQDIMRYKNDLENQLRYYGYNSYYKNQINNQIQRIKYEPCYKYKELSGKIR